MRWLAAGLVVLAGLATGTMTAGAKEGLVGAAALAVDSRAGRVFVATDRLRIYEAAAGRLLATAPLYPYADAVAVDEQADRAFVLTGSPQYLGPGSQSSSQGRLSVFAATTGRLVRVVAVDMRPLAMAVDAAAARLRPRQRRSRQRRRRHPHHPRRDDRPHPAPRHGRQHSRGHRRG